MNRDLALEMRQNLGSIIKGYEDYLQGQMLNGDNSILAIEGFVARDVVRTIGMSEVGRTRADRVTKDPQKDAHDPAQDAVVSSTTAPLFAEGGRIGSALQPSERTGGDSDSLFKNLEDCIPCNKSWEWKDFDWDRLKDILNADLMARFGWLTKIEDMLIGNEVIEQLCAFLHMFRNLCPQDLLVLIAALTAWLVKTIESIKFNASGILKDILGMILKPYIAGLEDFLNMYIQFYVDQIECIMNAIIVSAEGLRDMKVSNTLGPDILHFEADVITGRGDKFLDKTAGLTKKVRKTIREEPRKATSFIANDIPAYLVSIIREVTDWIELQVIKTQDAVMDLLGGEWLLTSKNISFIQQMRSVLTIIQILKIIVSLGDIDELCSEDNVRRVVDEANDRFPDDIVIEEDSDTGGGDGDPDPLPPNANDRPLAPVANQQPTPGGTAADRTASNARVRIPISLSQCLQRSSGVSEDQLRQWMSELS